MGSGFLASAEGHVLTNRHVAEPWWNNEAVTPLIEQGMVPEFVHLSASFPGKQPIAVDVDTIRLGQHDVDVAVLQVRVRDVPVLPLFSGNVGAVRGGRVIVLGYPTGLNAIFARAEPDLVAEVLANATDTTSLVAELAKRDAISPVITQGALNEVRERKLVYDAETTSGGSGGPVFGPDGTVIGVNFAITRHFDGSNFGIPIEFGRKLLP
jgi:S1-C subfamily serine protease